ncbi:MAG: SDR family NAD(P)-dependent oxidoreductase [bacterium]|nr:SDR family NAD(P)-dependent oxidoreductase [bacterium]
MKKVILITGASSGFGLHTAQLLASRGHHVYGTRLPHEDFQDERFHVLPLDVTDVESVQVCVQTVIAAQRRIDVLVNNAGIILLGAVEETTLDEAARVFDVNFFGAARMIQAVLPFMRAQRSGTILNVTSLAGLIGAPYQGYYAASKHALEGLTESLVYELRPFNIHLALIEPGIARTPLARHKLIARQPLTAYDGVRDRVIARWEHFTRIGVPASAVAAAVCRAVETDPPPLRQTIGVEALRGAFAKRLLPFSSLENGVSEALHVVEPRHIGQRQMWRALRVLPALGLIGVWLWRKLARMNDVERVGGGKQAP